MDKRCAAFVQEKLIELLQAGFSVNLKRTKYIENCNGYFCEGTKEFAVAIGKPQKEWLPIFVHEYAHFCQWRESSSVWRKAFDMCGDVDIFDDNLDQYTDAALLKAVRATQMLEQDCDKRALEMIIDHGLPFDPAEYVKRSNTYHWFYEVFRQMKSWYKIAPYAVPEIIEMMPVKFIDPSRFSRPPRKFVSLVKRHCY